MTELIQWVKNARELKCLHLLLSVALFTIVFLAIRPFQNGNGCLSRILTHLLLLRVGYTYVPHSYLESGTENKKKSYYLALPQTKGTNRDMVTEVGASPNTLKGTFSSLIEKGMLTRHGGGRSTWYALSVGINDSDDRGRT